MKKITNKLAAVGIAYSAALLFMPTASFADTAAEHYMEYEQREPCQYYKVMPQSLAGMDRCIVAEDSVAVAPMTLLPVVATYTIYFDFDKSNIRPNQNAIINKLANELRTYNPTQVTVVGHTDTAGEQIYNKSLSAKRADTVSKALNARNISNYYLDEHAVGEANLAVQTPDGTRLEENRRVVIQFRR